MARKRRSDSEIKDQPAASATATVEDGQRSKKRASTEKKKSPGAVDCGSEEESTCRFLGSPIPDAEARKRWPHRYGKDQSTVHTAPAAKLRSNIYIFFGL